MSREDRTTSVERPVPNVPKYGGQRPISKCPHCGFVQGPIPKDNEELFNPPDKGGASSRRDAPGVKSIYEFTK